MSISKFREKLEEDPRFRDNITFRYTIPAAPGKYEAIPDFVPQELQALLARRGITQLYSHQAQALQAVHRGQDIVVVTPTASGKTLCYNLPVIQALLENEETRALYLFPTKALAQDQVAELMAWSTELGGAH